MKKIIIVLFLSFSSVITQANLDTPQAYISEIIIDSTGNWTIEMGFFEYYPDEIDSIRLVTSTGSSLISDYSVILVNEGFQYLSVISGSNLVNPVSINPEGDFVKLISYAWEDEPFDKIAFGNYPGSYLDCIKDGESVCYTMYTQSVGTTQSFCIDKSPTPGIINDTTGALGNFSGIAYDLSGNPFTEGFFQLPGVFNTRIYINPDGTFSERVFSRRFTFDTINLYLPQSRWIHKIYTIEEVDFCLRPDSSHYQDIITTSLVIGVEEKDNDDENAVVISPNPFSDKVVFYFNLKNDDPSDDLSLSIYSIDGKEISRVSILPDQKRFEWFPGGEVSPGTLIYRLEMNKRVIKSGKFIKI